MAGVYILSVFYEKKIEKGKNLEGRMGEKGKREKGRNERKGKLRISPEELSWGKERRNIIYFYSQLYIPTGRPTSSHSSTTIVETRKHNQ